MSNYEFPIRKAYLESRISLQPHYCADCGNEWFTAAGVEFYADYCCYCGRKIRWRDRQDGNGFVPTAETRREMEENP